MDFSGVTIFRHTITMIVVVWRFLYCDEILKVMREDMMNDTFMESFRECALSSVIIMERVRKSV